MSTISWILAEVLGGAILIVAAFYIYIKYGVYNFWRKLNIFYVEPTFPIGNAYPIVSSKMAFHEFFHDVYQRYKSHRLFGLHMFFTPILVVTDPELVREVLTKEFASFHDRGLFCNEKTDPLTGHLFSLPGKKWRNLRVKLTPTFTSGKIKQMFQTIKDCGDSMSAFLEPKAQSKATVELKDILARFSTDIIMSVAFGINCNSLDNPNNEFRYWGKKTFEPKPFWNTLVIFAPKIFDLLNMPYTEKEVTNFFMKLFRENAEYRETHNINRKDFMDLLMQLMKNGYVEPDEKKDQVMNGTTPKETKLTMSEATAQAFVFFLAGFETSSTTATFCFYELARNQEIQNKVREEIQAVLKKHGGLTYDSLNDMTYLHKVLSETLRKYPPVGVLNRVCTKEIQLTGTKARIPTGTLVAIPVFGIHHDPEHYPDPEKFDPERFTKEQETARDPYTYLPFGEGPRICIGMRFGLVQTKVALVSALAKYRYKLSPDTITPVVYEKGILISAPSGGMHLMVEPA